LDQLLDTVRAGESAALVVRGEAGIGKTALLDHCVRQASGFQIVRIAGMQSEMELPFAGLHQLCAPVLAQVERLPGPQQNAIRVAFGLDLGDAPDRFLVALATLSLLAEVAEKRPLLCAIDDAQWLDAASGQVLGFVARRILAESVMMVFAIREPTEDHNFVGLSELRLQGLNDDDARALLVANIPGRVDARVRDRIVAETRGNPLAMLELPKGMTSAELGGGFAVLDSRDLPDQIQEHFLKRLEALPVDTQRLMLVAAADPTGDVGLLWRAAETLGIDRGWPRSPKQSNSSRSRRKCDSGTPLFAQPSIPQRRRKIAGQCIWPCLRPWIRIPTRTAASGIARWGRRDQTKRWRPSLSGQPVVLSRAAGWLRAPPSFSALWR
jgi:hypothetical protein